MEERCRNTIPSNSKVFGEVSTRLVTMFTLHWLQMTHRSITCHLVSLIKSNLLRCSLVLFRLKYKTSCNRVSITCRVVLVVVFKSNAVAVSSVVLVVVSNL